MKILFFTRLFYPHIGGVETHVYEVGKRLIEIGHKVSVVTEQYDKSLLAYETYKGFEIYRIPIKTNERKKKFEIWQWLWKHKDIILQADIVHCHDVFFWYLPFRLLHPTKRVFTTFHGYETTFPPTRKAIIIRKLSEKLSHGNICVGDFIKKWYGTNPTFVTYGGVDINQNLKIKTQKHNSKLKISFAGRINEDTGVYIYAEVLEILKSKRIQFEFMAIGDGPEKKVLSCFGEVKGFVKDPEKYIADSDIVFASSYLTILQAFAHKKLVIATYTNPLKKDYLFMAPFAKWIIVEQDPTQLAYKIISFNQNRTAFNKKREQAYEWAKEQTWEKVTDMYLKLWKL